jgi:hypothetical protein
MDRDGAGRNKVFRPLYLQHHNTVRYHLRRCGLKPHAVENPRSSTEPSSQQTQHNDANAILPQTLKAESIPTFMDLSHLSAHEISFNLSPSTLILIAYHNVTYWTLHSTGKRVKVAPSFSHLHSGRELMCDLAKSCCSRLAGLHRAVPKRLDTRRDSTRSHMPGRAATSPPVPPIVVKVRACVLVKGGAVAPCACPAP